MIQKTRDFTREEKIKLADLLLSDRLSNYGYDLTSWHRLQRQRYKARKEFMHKIGYRNDLMGDYWLIDMVDFNDIMEGRLYINENGQAEYCTGQSNNEEITNCMRFIVNPNATWVS